MRKCKVCGKRFRLKKEKKYLVETVSKSVIFQSHEEKKVYECFDCPACGCQNMCNIREVPGTKSDATLPNLKLYEGGEPHT